MYETLFILLIAALISLGVERAKPKPVSLGEGDTLMVRVAGYSFCPIYCGADHNHIGHYKSYNCKEIKCYHKTIKKIN